ncbi:MAG: ribosomal RNA small subunit methyltransferase A [Myxococcales bacterium]|nr:ribosomal RNA small subunit methyltransferase A [Myxococcales bacterium]MCB9577893.1 ribosomal RNA small subunit methyltransferase A [Polyangiaceae bacterium]
MAEAPRRVKDVLLEHGLRAKKHFGQNFLADAHLAAKLAELCTTPAGGSVVEIGAGLGALTRPLLERAERVVAIERDRDLIPILRQELSSFEASGRLEILEADAKTADFVALLAPGPAPRVLAGNLPYQLTGPLLQRATAVARHVDRAVFLVQLEVCDRVAAAAGSASYGALSVFVQAQFEPSRAFVLRRGAFYPQPNVDSAVLVLTPRPTPVSEETDVFRMLVSRAFEQRRKMLKNAWSGVPGVERAAARASIDLTLRGEALTVFDFAHMAQELS